jgi:hypothetical protein
MREKPANPFLGFSDHESHEWGCMVLQKVELEEDVNRPYSRALVLARE